MSTDSGRARTTGPQGGRVGTPKTSVRIDRPASTVWSYLIDPPKWRSWHGASLARITPGWQPGATLEWENGDRSLLSVCDEGRQLSIGGSFLLTTYRLTAKGDSMTLAYEVQPTGGASFSDGGRAHLDAYRPRLLALKGLVEGSVPGPTVRKADAPGEQERLGSGYCSLCHANVVLNSWNGTCTGGHGPEHISAVKVWESGMCWSCKTRPAAGLRGHTLKLQVDEHHGMPIYITQKVDVPVCEFCGPEQTKQFAVGFLLMGVGIAITILVGFLVGIWAGNGWVGFAAWLLASVGMFALAVRRQLAHPKAERVYDDLRNCPTVADLVHQGWELHGEVTAPRWFDAGPDTSGWGGAKPR